MSTKILCTNLKSKKYFQKVDTKVVKFNNSKRKRAGDYYFACNPMVVETAKNENWLPALALYFKVKRLPFTNSTIYKYSARKLSNLVQQDPRTVSRDVNKLVKLGLAIQIKGNLTFVSVSRLNTILKVEKLLEGLISGKTENYLKLKWTIRLKPGDSTQDVIDMMISKLVEFYALKQVIIGKEKLDIRSLQNPKETGVCLKRIKKLKKKYNRITYDSIQAYERAVWTEDKITFGYRKLAEHLGLSVMKTWRIVKRLQERGVLLVQNDEFYATDNDGMLLYMNEHQLMLVRDILEDKYKGFAFVNKHGQVKIRRASTYEFYEHSISILPIKVKHQIYRMVG